MTAEDFAKRAVSMYLDAYPNEPDVIAFRKALEELRQAMEPPV